MQKISEFEIVEIYKETKETTGLIIKASENYDLGFSSGQYLTLVFNVNSTEIKRSYSITSTPEELPLIHLAIKEYSDGIISKILSDYLAVGNKILAFPPTGNFTVQANPENEKTYVMIGAGSGITPLISMIKSILKNETKSKVFLIYGNREEDSIIYKKVLFELENQNKNFTVFHILSNPNKEWVGIKGRINNDILLKFAKNYSDEFANGEYYVCGPNEMIETVFNSLYELKVNTEQVHREIYTSAKVEQNI